MGLFHGAGAVPVPSRGGHPVLGQVLGLLVYGGHRRHRHRHPGAHRVRRVRGALLSQPRGVQVRRVTQ